MGPPRRTCQCVARKTRALLWVSAAQPLSPVSGVTHSCVPRKCWFRSRGTGGVLSAVLLSPSVRGSPAAFPRCPGPRHPAGSRHPLWQSVPPLGPHPVSGVRLRGGDQRRCLGSGSWPAGGTCGLVPGGVCLSAPCRRSVAPPVFPRPLFLPAGVLISCFIRRVVIRHWPSFPRPRLTRELLRGSCSAL